LVRNSEVSLRTVSDRITRDRNAIFGHVAGLPDNIPAHQTMLRQVELSVGRPADPTWKRPPGRLRTKWTDQLRRDNNNVPIEFRLCGGKLLVAVTRERRYGHSRLRVNDDDDDDETRVASLSVLVSLKYLFYLRHFNNDYFTNMA